MFILRASRELFFWTTSSISAFIVYMVISDNSYRHSIGNFWERLHVILWHPAHSVYSRRLWGNFPPQKKFVSDAYTSACNFESMKSKTSDFAVNPVIIIIIIVIVDLDVSDGHDFRNFTFIRSTLLSVHDHIKDISQQQVTCLTLLPKFQIPSHQ